MTFDIIRPSPRYLNVYLDTCRITWGQVHDNYILHDPTEFPKWKETIFADYRNQENGVGLPQGFVPSATFWLIQTEECPGVLNIRLSLSEKLRRYGGNIGYFVRPDRRRQGVATELIRRLPALFRQLKIKDQCLFTCYEKNKPSLRMLEKIDGTRQEKDTIEIGGKLMPIRRFYLSPAACTAEGQLRFDYLNR